MKKKKIIILVIALLPLIIIPVICYRIGAIRTYETGGKLEPNTIATLKKIREADTISITKQNYEGEYLTYKELKVPNNLQNYLLMNTEEDTVLYSTDEGFLLLGVINTIQDIKKSTKKDQNGVDVPKILEKNNINNFVDMTKYIANYKFSNKNIFTPVSKIKEDYYIYWYTTTWTPTVYDFSFLTGDYEGYIASIGKRQAENASRYEVVLVKGDKTYFFTSINNKKHVTKEEIIDLISKTVID